VTAEFARQRIAAQMPIDEKRALATWLIDNSGSLAATERQVRELHARLTVV
jgi:dephospho-CoA kinase